MSRFTRATVQSVAVVAVFTLAAAACGSSSKKASTSPSTSAGPAVKIGFFGALTGPNAQLGINIDDGVKLAVDQHNKKAGVKQVQLVPYDSQGDPSQAPQLAQKAISDKVVAIVGPAFSGESKQADPIFEQAQIVNVTPSATAVELAQNGWKYWHRILANDGTQGPQDASYIAKKLGTKVAVIDDNSSYGLGLGNAVRQSLATDGATVAVSDHIDPNAQDYSATVNKVKAANPDAVFFGGYYAAGGLLLKQLRDANVTAKFMSDDGAKDPKLVSTAGTGAAEGAVVSCPCRDVSGTFPTDYQAAFNAAPGTYSAEGYDAANLIMAAIDAGKTTGPAINTYLASVSYNGITKTIKFDAQGEVTGGAIYIYDVKSGIITFSGSVNQLVGG